MSDDITSLLIRCDSLLSLAVHRGEGPHVPEWKMEAQALLRELRAIEQAKRKKNR